MVAGDRHRLAVLEHRSGGADLADRVDEPADHVERGVAAAEDEGDGSSARMARTTRSGGRSKASSSVRKPARRSPSSSACTWRDSTSSPARVEQEHALRAGRRSHHAPVGVQPAGGPAERELTLGVAAVALVGLLERRQQPRGRARRRSSRPTSARTGRDAERELALCWATGWLHANRRVVAPATRPQGVLLFDSSPRLDVESLHVQALELGLRRAGFRTLLLAFDLPPERVVRAIRALDPVAFVFCGGDATLDVVGRLVYTVRQVGSAAPVFEYREAMPVTGDHGIPSLGSMPVEAAERLKGYVDSGRIEQVVVVPEPEVSQGQRIGVAARNSA